MPHLTAVTIIVDYPDGYTVAGAMLADLGPFDDAGPLIEAVRDALGSAWVAATTAEIRAHYAERYSESKTICLVAWEQLNLF